MTSRFALASLFLCLLVPSCFGSSTSGPDAGNTTADPGTPTPLNTPTPSTNDPMADNLASRAGDYAYFFLRDDTFDRLVIEVDYVAGHPPSQDALDFLVNKIDELCFKPGGITVVLDDEIPDQGSPSWTVGQAQAIEVQYRDQYRDADTGTALMYFLYLDGNSAADTNQGRVLAFAYHGSSIVMFDETIDSVGGGLLLTSDVEDVVLMHEAGHLLGLVDNGVPMQVDHRDDEHGKHDSNSDCLMHWTINSEQVTDVLLNRTPDFDANCRADMTAAGGRP